MQKMIGYMRKAITDYGMLADGDKVAVGISGGKDSVVLLAGLIRLREFMGVDFSLVGITIDPCFDGNAADYSLIEQLCREHGVEYIIKRSDLWDIIFNQREEKNPCSLCARMRRGMLHDICNEYGANKLALGHHLDDAVETFIMNLFHEGRVGCFQPVTYLSRKDITMIRPLIFAPEKDIASAARRCGLPVMKGKCPVDGNTSREDTKKWIVHMDKNGYPGLKKRLFGAIKRGHISGW